MKRRNFAPIAFTLLVLMGMIWTVGFGPDWVGSDDEGFRLHAAWLTAQGSVPYRDFFDNQMPNFNFLSLPLLKLSGSSPGYLRAGQWLYFGLLGFGFLGLSRKLSTDYLPGATAVFLLGVSPVTGTVTGEFRPDLPTVSFGILGIILLYIALQSEDRVRGLSILSGLFLGISPFVKVSGLFFLPGAVYLLLAERSRSRSRFVVVTFTVVLTACLLGQFLLWGLLSPRFLEYTIGTHQLTVPSGDFGTLVYRWSLENILILTGVFLYCWRHRKTHSVEVAFLVTGAVGLLFYVASPPGSPSPRHLFGVVALLAYPAGSAFARLIRPALSGQQNVTLGLTVLLLGTATVIVLMNSPLNHRPHVNELAEWINGETDPGDHVLTDFPYMNVLAQRPQPPHLANVSSNLTYTGYIDRTRIERAFRETPPVLILVQLDPHPWHLANVPGMESMMTSWLSDWGYEFAGIRTPSETLFLVFAQSGLNPDGVSDSPTLLQKQLGPLLKAYSWNQLGNRLLPE